MITSPSTGVNSTAWDFVTHYSPINAWVPKNIVVVNQRVFDGLDEATQKAVLDAAAVAEKRGWEMSMAEAESKTAELATNGIVVYDPSPALVEGLQGIGKQMLESWQTKASDSAKAILDAYNNN